MIYDIYYDILYRASVPYPVVRGGEDSEVLDPFFFFTSLPALSPSPSLLHSIELFISHLLR